MRQGDALVIAARNPDLALLGQGSLTARTNPSDTNTDSVACNGHCCYSVACNI